MILRDALKLHLSFRNMNTKERGTASMWLRIPTKTTTPLMLCDTRLIVFGCVLAYDKGVNAYVGQAERLAASMARLGRQH